MTSSSKFSFLRRVRIHDGECGAVARALHHAVKGSSLYQADPRKVLGSTNERKQMSTKTTLKRIALVAVSALGFGLLGSVSPARAAGDATFSVDATSFTVIGTGGTAASTPSTSQLMAIVKIRVSDNDAIRPLASGETITATVVGVPVGTSSTAKSIASNSSDLKFRELEYPTSAGGAYSIENGASSGLATDGVIGSRNTAQFDSSTTGLVKNTYLLGIHGDSTSVLNQGVYTVRLTLTDANSFVLKTQDIKVDFVSAITSASPVITITQTGTPRAGSAYTYTSTLNTKVNITNRDGGKIFDYSASATGAAALDPGIPTLVTHLVDEDGLIITVEPADTGLSSYTSGVDTLDTGVAAVDHVASSSDSATVALNVRQNAFQDGNYGINGPSTMFDTATTIAATAGRSVSWRVRWGATEVTKELSLYSAASANAATSTAEITATGSFPMSTNTGLMGYGNQWTLPLSTTSAVLKIRAIDDESTDVPVQDYPLTFTVTWTNAAAGEVTPRSGSTYATTVRTDSNGYASLTLTNATPIDGARASVAITGFADTVAAQRIVWAKSKPATISADPNATFKAKTGSTNTVTWTVLDTFGAPVAGTIMDLSIAGANSATSTVVIPSATTNASGQVSYTFTDAAGVEASTTLGTTTLTATSREVSTVTSSRVITWVATVPVISSFLGYYNENEGTSGATSYSDVVPATVIYDTPAQAAGFLINTGRNLTRSLAIAGDDADQVAFRFIAKDSASAGVTGVPVTVTVSDGLHIIGSAGLPVSSRVIYPSTGGYVDFIVLATKTGTHTITVTAGSVSATASIEYENVEADARYLTLAGDSTGTANADKLPAITATVTDRFGNPVSGVDLQVTHTGIGRLAGGSKTAQYTTGSDGMYTFELSATEAGTATVQVLATATSGQMTDLAGYKGTTALVDAITAGNRTASASVTFAAGESASSAAATAAADAALEAIDAANAATDAANLAAEAADAATVAAEEARDAADSATAAVEALASEVATLMAALKAQITTLAKTVAKIAKKVKA